MTESSWQGPLVIGGTGGSGTRVLVEILQVAGGYMGTKVNGANDSTYLGRFIKRWLRTYLHHSDKPMAIERQAEMIRDFQDCLRKHLEGLPRSAAFWGWKNPPNVFLLPFLHRECKGLRFIHLLRDGRDMAFSKNQYDLRNYGDVVFQEDWMLRICNVLWRLSPTLVRSDSYRAISLWSKINVEAAKFGEHVLKDRYLRIHFESLCSNPLSEIRKIFRFVGVAGLDESKAVACVRVPDTISRWRKQDHRAVMEICQAGRVGLERFGYWSV